MVKMSIEIWRWKLKPESEYLNATWAEARDDFLGKALALAGSSKEVPLSNLDLVREAYEQLLTGHFSGPDLRSWRERFEFEHLPVAGEKGMV